jgi:hypothetical protein
MLRFAGRAKSNSQKFSKQVRIPSRRNIHCPPLGWPENFEIGSLNIGIDDYPSGFVAPEDGGRGVAELEQGSLEPVLVLEHFQIISPFPDKPARGRRQFWPATLTVSTTKAKANCWVCRRIGTAVVNQLELISYRKLRDYLRLEDGIPVQADVYGQHEDVLPTNDDDVMRYRRQEHALQFDLADAFRFTGLGLQLSDITSAIADQSTDKDTCQETIGRAITLAMVVAYTRPFTKNMSGETDYVAARSISTDILSSLTKEERKFHESLITRRNEEYAHSDASAFDMSLSLRTVGEDVRGWNSLCTETARPFAPFEIEELRSCICKISQALRESQREIRGRLQDREDF